MIATKDVKFDLNSVQTVTLPSGLYDVMGKTFCGPGTVIIKDGKIVGGSAKIVGGSATPQHVNTDN